MNNIQNNIDADLVKRGVSRLRQWMVWAQTQGVPHPYYEEGKAKQDNGRVMLDQIADIRMVCAAAEARGAAPMPSLVWEEVCHGETHGFLSCDLSTTVFIIRGTSLLGGAPYILGGAFIPNAEDGENTDKRYTFEEAQAAAKNYLIRWWSIVMSQQCFADTGGSPVAPDPHGRVAHATRSTEAAE